MSITVSTPPSSANPGGSNTQIQFNNNGVFGGDANLTWVTPRLTVLGIPQENIQRSVLAADLTLTTLGTFYNLFSFTPAVNIDYKLILHLFITGGASGDVYSFSYTALPANTYNYLPFNFTLASAPPGCFSVACGIRVTTSATCTIAIANTITGGAVVKTYSSMWITR